MNDYVGSYWQLCRTIIWKARRLKLIGFKAWNCGLSSTERRNIARVKKVLNALDELNEGNLQGNSAIFFRNLKEAVKDFMIASGYDVKTTETSYSIRRKHES